jgi:acetyl esterase/lipase
MLIYIHGGAWMFGDKRKPPLGRTMPICWHFAGVENWVVLNVKYVLSNLAFSYSQNVVDPATDIQLF